VTKWAKSCPLETIHTVTTEAFRPEGPAKVARISNVCPCGLACPGSASPERASSSNASRSVVQSSGEKPSSTKKTDLNRPTGCDDDSRYSRTLASCQVATSEAVVVHHAREVGRYSSRQGAAGSCNGLLGGDRHRRYEGYGPHALTRFRWMSCDQSAGEPSGLLNDPQPSGNPLNSWAILAKRSSVEVMAS
jgi:hypothetical protein